MGSGILRY